MTSHASRRTAHQGRSSSFIHWLLIKLTGKTDYTNKPLAVAEQIAQLKQRRLVFDNESEVSAYLFNISYYRFVHTSKRISRNCSNLIAIYLTLKIWDFQSIGNHYLYGVKNSKLYVFIT